MRRVAAIAVLVLTVALWPQPAPACSCGSEPYELGPALREARARASHIYFARILASDGNLYGGTATAEVLEVFKGKLRAGAQLKLPSGGGGDCTIGFKAGQEYLLYAFGHATAVGMCTRSRLVKAGDAEMQWLRTGRLPPTPASVQRESVQCTPCSLGHVAEALTGTQECDVCSTGPRIEAMQAFEARRPFWSSGARGNEWLQLVAVGLDADGRAFELVHGPDQPTWEVCRRRVSRRWCERLEPTGKTGWGELPLRCVNPGPQEAVCDEGASRTATWGPSEPMSAAVCEWGDPAHPFCTFVVGPQLVPPSDWRSKPQLRCSPAYEHAAQYFCEVVASPP